ncbi:MAG TPA: class I SAM-dependent methyltransferase [Elusimicrobiota bacterium]|nr:class I SAM-dependent methyltransferase [Elusimicrobiota bacterium]
MKPSKMRVKLSEKWVRFITRLSILRKIHCGGYNLTPASCPVCHGNDRILVAKNDRDGLPASIWLCRDCGMVYQSPHLDTAALQSFYGNEYRRLYRGNNAIPEDYIDRGKRRGEAISTFMKSHGISIGKAVLEIGCGPGGILKCFDANGHEVTGTEWDHHCVKAGKVLGIDIIYGGIDQLLPLKKKYDFVIFNHLIEHLDNPVLFLRNAQNLMHTQSILYIETPGLRHPDTMGHFRDTIQLAHLTYFDSFTLNSLLKAAGYQTIMIDETCHYIGRPLFKQGNAFSKGKPSSDNFESNHSLLINARQHA